MNPHDQAMHDGPVKSLFTKIMLAQVAAVVLALLVVLVITRFTLQHGFVNFLERQEGAVLNQLAPTLGEIYVAELGWDFLRDDPELWTRILRRSSQLHQRPPKPSRVPPHFATERLHWLRGFDRLQLRQRLFLLDEAGLPLAGPVVEDHQELVMEPIEAEGRSVGWIGFAPMDRGLPAEANRFLRGQVRAHMAALAVALALIVLLAFALSRHLTRPVRQLDHTVRDLTRGQFGERARVFGNDEIGRLAENVNRLAETLENNRSARHRWMTDIAHELRTPVAILKGEVEALNDGVRKVDNRTFASLGEEINHLSALVNDLQSLALSDAGALTLNLQSFDLTEVVKQAINAFRERFDERAIQVEVVAEGPVSVTADAQRIRQLINNLLENCARYTQDKGKVRISISTADREVHIAVEDSGPGVTDSVLDRLFDRFFKADNERFRAGTGLGLAICKSIAKAHGGEIHAEKSPLGGLGVHLTLPN